MAAAMTDRFSVFPWNIRSMAWRGSAWKGRSTDMNYDLPFMVTSGVRRKSARGLAQSKTLARSLGAGMIPPGLGVRWPSTALAALTLMIFGLTTAFAETLLLSG